MKVYPATAALAAALLSFGPFRVLAASDTGRITIVVSDVGSKAPLDFARVVLDGPVITNQLSGRDGKVVFEDVPTGIYKARVAKNGYQTVTSAQFEVTDGKEVTVDVTLVKSQDPKTLGNIVVTSTASISTTDISQSSPLRKLSDTLADALGKLSGVALVTDPNGDSDASVTVSLDGHDASQTSVTLDGVPLNAPGQTANLQQINTDLFSGASVSRNPLAGALGGGVNFRTVEPTLTWQGSFTTSVGSYDKASSIFTEQGSLGRLGIAVVHSIRGSQNPLSGLQYLDASGLNYPHAGGDLTGGDLVKLRAPFGSEQTLTATFLSNNNFDDLLCTRFTGPVPCGYGPGNASYRHFSFGSFSDAAVFGLTGVQLTAYGTQSRYDRDLLERLVNGVPSPFGTETDLRTRGTSLNVQLPSRQRHTISLQASTTTSNVTIVPLVSRAAAFASGSSASSFSSFTISDNMRSSNALSLGERIGFSSSTGSGASILGNINATWTPRAANQFVASIDVGGANGGPPHIGVLTDPQSLRFDCNSGLAYGNGPGDSPGPQSSMSQRLSWQHRFAKGQVTTVLYRQVQNDTLVNALVNAPALPAGYFPANYFPIAQNLFQSPAGCGSSANFGPQNVFISLPIGDIRRVYEGVQLSGAFALGPNVLVLPYFNTQVAKALSSDSRLSASLSTTIPGSQLPNVPLHRAGLTIDEKAANSPLELLFNAQYVSENNGNNLPAYVSADAGAVLSLPRAGSLTIAVNNVFNTYAGTFATFDNAVPLPTLDGSPLPTVARPLSPRQVSLTYSVRTGRGAQKATPGRSVTADLTRQGQGPPQQGFAGLFAPLTKDVPQHPLDAQSRPQCTAELRKSASPTLDGLKAYVAAIEAAKTETGYPDAVPASAPDVPGLAIAYHKVGASYALVLTPTQGQFLRGLAACAAVRIGTQEQAQSLQLYAPQPSALTRFVFAFAPAAGLYAVRYPQQPGQEQFRLYRLPTAPPTAPFALTSAGVCTADLRPTAQKVLDSLAKYVAGYDPAHPPAEGPEGFTVTPRQGEKGWWLELAPKDFSAIPAVLSCGRVAAGTADEVKATGFGGARLPALNYAPALGLYVIRQQFPQPAAERS